jgi:hypothetical protein
VDADDADGDGAASYDEAWLRELLTAENAARLSADTQAAYAAAEAADADPAHGWMEVTDALQRRLLRQRGVPPEREAAALRALRAATHTFPALAAIPLYRRFQRARAGALAPGDAPPDVPLLAADGSRTTLLSGVAAARAPADGRATPLPLLICAGSVS